ncbi:hypothetical protein [uncultured Massilia sp.]|uniref:hypothetical protein n=1 Tax=uncultured Massilia sp. TaxID=169973 RepID=UPI0025F9D826|nr:hypothetical protein [uncultured Massilia sp.]
MSLLLRAALLCFLLASFAIAARAAPFDDPLLRNAAATGQPVDLTLSSGELPADDADLLSATLGIGAADVGPLPAGVPSTTPDGGAPPAPLRAGIGSVPEPQASLLLGAGLLLLGAAGRRAGRNIQKKCTMPSCSPRASAPG